MEQHLAKCINLVEVCEKCVQQYRPNDPNDKHDCIAELMRTHLSVCADLESLEA